MRRSPLFSGIIYLVLGALFTYFAVEDVHAKRLGIFQLSPRYIGYF